MSKKEELKVQMLQTEIGEINGKILSLANHKKSLENKVQRITDHYLKQDLAQKTKLVKEENLNTKEPEDTNFFAKQPKDIV